MTDDEPVRLSATTPVASVTLARSAKRNALSGPFAEAVAEAFAAAEAAGARIVVLRSDSPVFCAGVDLSEPMRLDQDSPELVLARALLDTRMFVVTVVEGPVLAGGLIITALSPVVIAGEAARFWLPERGIGIFPGRVLAYLERVMGPRQALWHGLTERRVDAEEAVRLGLASVAAPHTEIDAETTRVTDELAAAAPAFVRAARDSWAQRFDDVEHRRRRDFLDRLLKRNVGELDR